MFGKPDLVHVHVPIKMGIPGLWIKRNFGIPYVVTEHWGIYNDIDELNYSKRSITFKKFTKAIIEKASALISVSKYLAEGVNRLVTTKVYSIIPNVVNTNLFFYTDPKESIDFRFIHVSNMVPLKNVEGILRAFQLFLQTNRDVELIVVGDKDPAIRNYATTLGLDREVHFRGEVPYAHVATEMQSANCLVLYSNIENSPCVIGEAFCSGLPVIASRVGGIPELVDESNGLLVDPQNDAMLAAAMTDMKNRYSFFNRKKIAEEAGNKFSYPVIGKKIDEVYSRIINPL
jgi:glycosyltransferase involved in cell wall biosynthesis